MTQVFEYRPIASVPSAKSLVMRHPDIEFIQQFKEQAVTLPVIDQRHGNICLRYFTQKRRDRHLLRKFVEKEMDQTHTVNELITRLEDEDLAITRRLIHCMAGLLDAFPSDTRKEPYSATYYQSLPADILQFLKFLSSEENPHVVLYNRLTDVLVCSKSSSPHEQTCQKDVPTLMNLLKASRDIMYAYNNMFAKLMQQESAGMGKLRGTSRTGQRLAKVLRLMVSLISTTTCTLTRLAEWQKLVKNVESQGMYN